MKIALIPARGGSKRIKKKNIKLFSGEPLIHYPIKACIETGLFDKIIVSTDSEEIAEIANSAGAETPFIRPSELSDDFTPTIPVIKHAISWLENNNFSIEYCCCVYANPFVTFKNIIQGYNLLKEKQAMSVVPVTTFPFPIFRGVKVNENGEVEFIFPEKSIIRSQDLLEAYHDTGQFYWWDSKRLMAIDEISRLQCESRYPLIIPRYQSQDLDTIEDWEVAEILYDVFRM